MSRRIFRGLVLLCALASAVRGSRGIYSNDRLLEDRNRRHASCPSCRRDDPAALASSWYSQPPRREQSGFEPAGSNWPFQPNPSSFPSSYGPFDGAPGGRGAPGINRSPGDTSNRENPLNVYRDFDPNMAPAPPASVHGLGGPMLAPASPVSVQSPSGPVRPYQPRFSGTRTSARYQNPNFYDTIKREPGLAEASGYSEYDEVPFKPMGPFSEARDDSGKLHADRYSDYEGGSLQVQPGQYGPRSIPEQGRSPFYQPRRPQPRFPAVAYAPEARHSPHDRSQDLDRQKMSKARGQGTETGDSPWQTQFRDQTPQNLNKNSFQTIDQDDQQQVRASAMTEGYQQEEGRKEEPEQLKGKRDATDEGNVGTSTEAESLSDTTTSQATTESHLMRIQKRTVAPPGES